MSTHAQKQEEKQEPDQFVQYLKYTQYLFKMINDHKNRLVENKNKLISIVLNTQSSCEKTKYLIDALIEINLRPKIDTTASDGCIHGNIDEYMRKYYQDTMLSTLEAMTQEQKKHDVMMEGIKEILKDTSIANHDEKVEKIKLLLL